MILIKNGRVIDPESRFDGLADVYAEDGKIVRIVKKGAGKAEGGASSEEVPETTEVIDATGLVVAPGLVDVHVHFRDPGLTHKEDIETGAAAAMAGGYTTVVCMANTTPVVDSVETLQYILEKGKKTGIRVLAAAAISKGLKGKELTDMELLKENGAVGFTDDGSALTDVLLVEKAMREAKRLDVPLSFHEEDPVFIVNNGINQGEVSDKLGIGGASAMAEDTLVARDCMLALHTEASINIQHVSSKNAVRMIGLAKTLGAEVWTEVTPHHFALDEMSVLEYGTLAKVNPPLRTPEDRDALIIGLKDGTIDMIATDHAPHSAAEKAKPLVEAPSGMIGLETALALAVTNLVKPKYLSYVELFEKMCLNPSRFYHLETGRIAEGAPADFVVFDDREFFKVHKFHSKSANSPFVGKTLAGKVKYTVCDGKVVFKD